MTRLFRSKSCGGGWSTGTMFHLSPPSPSPYIPKDGKQEEEEEEEEEEEDDEDSPVTTPFIISPERRYRHRPTEESHNHQFPILDILAAVLRKSLVTCSVEREDVASSMDIGWPTDVRHVSHVTFDRFNGFLGLPVELEPELLRKVPSASVRVFGVSANSMQCSHDQRGNSVPTILLMMQKRLYSEGGLQAEGIFRINAENSQEEYVRNQLNKGVVPHGIDVHCLAGLIKAWFRELPAGVLDCLTPEQVMHCNTEDEHTQLLKFLPPTEAALLDWAINLMADVVQYENHNKMNAHNIAMVFAPNMTQMADPLTALIHAVQVMNFLRTLIIKTLREREKSAAQPRLPPSCSDSPRSKGDSHSSNPRRVLSHGQTFDGRSGEGPAVGKLFRSVTIDRFGSDSVEKFWSFPSENNAEEGYESVSDKSSTVMGKREKSENGLRGQYDDGEVEGIFDRLGLKKGVRKLCRHPVFQLSKPVKKSGLEALGL
ncbi:rho GTPase-activating protein 3-like [Actinidia eriantha]|uniref:rho GTPase-activating protein 3-like n=1 Tax=Actinidia eriantha TaxID=165200 RepID=UPI00258AB8B5|nr:rho GTPase-activating protein 3-like [Actinidia eriantha]